MKFVLLFILLEIFARKNKVRSCGQLPTVLVPLLTNAHTTHRWPWHVAVYHKFNNFCSIYQCGGTLISSNSILTAAHCVEVTAAEVTVSLGRLLLDASERSAPLNKIADIIRHPRYTSENQDHDIAIIILETDATFNNYVQPVCLWRTDQTDLSDIIGKYGTVVGWGRTETGQISNALRQASLPVVSHTTCLKSNRDVFGRFLTDTNFCAGTQNGTSVCSGDSGGSMTFEVNGRYYIRGVVSVGPGKFIEQRNEIVCDPTQFTIFTDVVPYLPWIRSSGKLITNEEKCDVRVPCGSSEESHYCTVVLDRYIQSSSLGCRDRPWNSEVTELTIGGESDVIPELSDAATKFRNLDSLVFQKMLLKVEREKLAPFGNIRKLNLSSNDISQFDSDTFDDLINLTKLDISYNKLTKLPADLFKKLAGLEFLDISRNRLTTLPATIFRSNWNIQHFKISYNQLKDVHVDLFNDLQNLEQLGLQGNKLETLPAQLFHTNRKMQALNLGQNQLKELHVDLFKELIYLELLFLNTNRLEVVPADIFRNNVKLRGLDLAKNQLKEVHVDLFKELLSLQLILLHFNRLETIPPGIFRNNRKLRYIDLSSNKIDKIEPDFHPMTHTAIQTIGLEGNVCIDEMCHLCDAFSLLTFFEKIEKNC